MTEATRRLPTLFIAHGGGPCFFMDWNPPDTWRSLERWLRGLADEVGQKPRALLVISAHWEAERYSVTAQTQPALIYDYYGFPQHTYELQYPAPGDPALAREVVRRLSAAGLPAVLDHQRGFDHGVFVPFKLIYPDADIPIVQLSLRAGLNPSEHLAVGAALASLRDEGVLIVGSGYSYHNMRGYGGAGLQPSIEFDRWLAQTLTADPETRNEQLRNWENAPSARAAHPREEHLLPLMIAAGAAGEDVGQQLFSELVFGVATSGFRFG